MLGSWAGAMGQPQFMPSNFFDYAVDFSANGRRDIWNDVPDVLASIANYLRKEGWNNDLTWGFEVIIPQDFDYRRSRGSFADWAQLGLRRHSARNSQRLATPFYFFPAERLDLRFWSPTTSRSSGATTTSTFTLSRCCSLRIAYAGLHRSRLRGPWMIVSYRATNDWRCKRNWPSLAMRSATSKGISTSTCAMRFASFN